MTSPTAPEVLTDQEIASIFARGVHWAMVDGFRGAYEIVTRALATILDLKANLADLERQVYVPGQWRCAKCKFTLQRQTIDVAGGGGGVSERDRNEPERCPNGCGPLWRVSERTVANELCDSIERLFEEKKAAESLAAQQAERIKVLEEVLKPIFKFLDNARKRHIGRPWSDIAKDKRILAVWLAEMTPQSTPDCTMAELFAMYETARAALTKEPVT